MIPNAEIDKNLSRVAGNLLQPSIADYLTALRAGGRLAPEDLRHLASVVGDAQRYFTAAVDAL